MQLYDSQELLSMDSKVANGYIILMGGIQSERDMQTQKLAFMALLEGNVIEACFGVNPHTSNPTSTSAKMVKDVKRVLGEAVDVSEAVQALAVNAYAKAFQVVVDYDADMKRLNFITRCFRSKKIHRKADHAFEMAFQPLQEAIAAATI